MQQLYQFKHRPHVYPTEKQQEQFLKALEFCGIKKGIKKSELQDKMKNCLPGFFKHLKEQENAEGKETDYALQPR